MQQTVGWLATISWGKRGGLLIMAVVFSHWLLDLLVHRPDLPILPGNIGNLPLLGFGLFHANDKDDPGRTVADKPGIVSE